jgi:murein DD-endopeptidase MepM/ murein hydrolase activator NlpD
MNHFASIRTRLALLACAFFALAGLSAAPAPYLAQPVFRSPVVPGAVISGYFDHNTGNDMVTHYNGLGNNSPAYGYFFSCPSVGMYDFVGCADNVTGEGACDNSRELWYDGHRGIDYEFAANWHTGAVCDPGRFSGLTMPIYAPAAGRVLFAGYDPNRPANGWHIRLKHDLNGNGNFDDDQFRSIYLHFTAYSLAVSAGQTVGEGQYLGLGGSTGYSSSPHLHFEVQRSTNYFQSSYWSVDPFGWQGLGADPWPYQNVLLFRMPNLNLPPAAFLPVVLRNQAWVCTDCPLQLVNGGFESGAQAWQQVGVEVVVNTSHPRLTVSPYAGTWMAWLGGRNSATDRLYQDFVLPSGQNSAELRYFVRTDTTETSGVYDVMLVRLRTADGTLLRDLDRVDNGFRPLGQWVERVVAVGDIGGWAGQTLRLSFEATTDGSAVSSFYLDEVQMK